MNTQSFIKIIATRIDDGSLYYNSLKNYERIQTWIAVHAHIDSEGLHFSSSGRTHLLDMDHWSIEMIPII